MTQQKNAQMFPSAEAVSKFFESWQKMPFDVQGLVEIQRKNWATVSEAQQKALENFQAIAHRQAELLSQALEIQSSLTSELMKEGKPEDKLARNAEAIKNSYEQALANAAELSEMVKKANADAVSLLNKRVSASMKEARSALSAGEKSRDRDAA